MPDAKPLARYHLVEVSLASRIRDGEFGEGAMPGERALAEAFGVARVTIRHALQRLEAQGLVLRQGRRGTLAVPGKDAARRRRLLREHVDQFLDRGRPDQRKVLRFARTEAGPAVAEALAIARGDPVLRIVRLRSRAGVPMTYTEAFIPAHLAHHIDRAALGRKAFMQLFEDSGIRIGAARQTVRAERAPAEVAAQLAIHPHDPVLRLERVVLDADDRPLQYLLGWYRADRFEVGMQLSRTDDVTRVWIGQR